MICAFRILSSGGILNELGHVSDIPNFFIDTPQVVEADSKAEAHGRLVLALLARRLSTGLWHCKGIPGLFAGIRDREEGYIITIRPRFCYGAYRKAQEHAGSNSSPLREYFPECTSRMLAASLPCASHRLSFSSRP